ncbi:heavy-metal-associated domain-containing protein [Sulfitobacter delicatus]|uniref:Copper chaperone n=1 Tax=Sulfitobacter delicatus TaxID=218672 RepID=A0A1G7KFU4_9RHOB|nr:heavy-metal-associated domain-containing protein [Sulfitobacter delicatus]SDF36025.1 copper chaperone [Sulfitobacter delicatus]
MKTLNLPGMTCGGCARSVTAAIKELDPEATVTADVAARRVTVKTTVSDQALRDAVMDAGYNPA